MVNRAVILAVVIIVVLAVFKKTITEHVNENAAHRHTMLILPGPEHLAHMLVVPV